MNSRRDLSDIGEIIDFLEGYRKDLEVDRVFAALPLMFDSRYIRDDPDLKNMVSYLEHAALTYFSIKAADADMLPKNKEVFIERLLAKEKLDEENNLIKNKVGTRKIVRKIVPEKVNVIEKIEAKALSYDNLLKRTANLLLRFSNKGSSDVEEQLGRHLINVGEVIRDYPGSIVDQLDQYQDLANLINTELEEQRRIYLGKADNYYQYVTKAIDKSTGNDDDLLWKQHVALSFKNHLVEPANYAKLRLGEKIRFNRDALVNAAELSAEHRIRLEKERNPKAAFFLKLIYYVGYAFFGMRRFLVHVLRNKKLMEEKDKGTHQFWKPEGLKITKAADDVKNYLKKMHITPKKK